MAIRFERRGFRIAALVLWIAFAGYTMVREVMGAVSGYQRLYAHPVLPSIYGVYDVESFTQLGKPLELATDAAESESLRDRVNNDLPDAYSPDFDA